MSEQRRGSGRLDYMDGVRWGDAALKDARGWVEGVKHVKGRELEAYSAGFEQGFREALAVLTLHGVVYRFDRAARDGRELRDGE